MEKLKDCPFCGNQHPIIEETCYRNLDGDIYPLYVFSAYVKCKNCGASGQKYATIQPRLNDWVLHCAINAWNQRSADGKA